MHSAQVWPFLNFAVVCAGAWLGVILAGRVRSEWWRRWLRRSGIFVAVACTLLFCFSFVSAPRTSPIFWRFLVLCALPMPLLLPFWVLGKIRIEWVREPLRALGGSVIFLLFILFLTLVAFFETGCVRRLPPLYSPDGKWIVLSRVFGQGALGADSVSVSIRRAWQPFSEVVYSGGGYCDFAKGLLQSPEVRWLDATHLQIRYWDDRVQDAERDPAVCKSRVGAVVVGCENLGRH